MEIVLVTGSARSGKSTFAEKYAAAAARQILGLLPEQELPEQSLAYLATAQIFDEEMRFRVQRHQARRSKIWQTYEVPVESLAMKAIQEAGKKQKALLFDCVTIYLSNLLCACTEAELADEAGLYLCVEKAIGSLIAAAETVQEPTVLVFVTNEVGAGIVPENALARRYRDLAGLANQQLAEAAKSVYLTVCGQAINIKSLALDAAMAAAHDFK